VHHPRDRLVDCPLSAEQSADPREVVVDVHPAFSERSFVTPIGRGNCHRGAFSIELNETMLD
jgi:hypothetical protein